VTSQSAAAVQAAQATTIADATGLACGSFCCDVVLTVERNRIVEAANACPRCRAWFLQTPRTMGPAATLDGKPATLDVALDRAAQLLSQARRPLVYGLRHTTTETQRAAVAVADRLGALLDTPGSHRGPHGVTFQGVGEVTATLGEIRHRADVVVFWGTNPAVSQPRHLERFSLHPQGEFLPNGRSDRFIVVVDTTRTATAELADLFIQIEPGRDFEALWILRALVRAQPLALEEAVNHTGAPLDVWRQLAAKLLAARYGALLYGSGLSNSAGGYLNVEALNALVRDLHVGRTLEVRTRCVARAMGGPGNLTGASDVLTWQTGFPFGVDFAHGYPRFNTDDFAAERVLERNEVDAALVVAADPDVELSAAAAARLGEVPTVVVGSFEMPAMQRAAVTFRTAVPGIDHGGTVHRVDGIALPLRPALTSPLPVDGDLLAQIERRLAKIHVGSSL
jgi:formylmethanofuran dehydrogenase subunit B